MITWLEDPSVYRYLRKGTSARCHRMENQWKKGEKEEEKQESIQKSS